MKQQLKEKRKPYIFILILLFLGSFLYAVYNTYGTFELKKEAGTPKEIVPEYFDYGVIANSTYCNDFFRFRVPVQAKHKGNYKVYDYIEKSIYEKDSVLAKPKLSSKVKNQSLLIIEPELIKIDWMQNIKETKNLDAWNDYLSKKSRRERFGADYQMIIQAHNLSGKPLGSYIRLFENLHHPNYIEPRTKVISNVTFQEYVGVETQSTSMESVTFRLLGGENRNICSYITEINGFALSIDLFYKTEEQKCILMRMAEEITFH